MDFINRSTGRKNLFNRPARIVLFLGAIMFLINCSTLLALAAEPVPTQSSVSAAYERYQQKKLKQPQVSSSAVSYPGVPEGQSLGWVPSPLDLPHLKSSSSGSGRVSASMTFPAYYDLRVEGRVTPVRNQNICGVCWAFSNIGSLESIQTPQEFLDFSEMNLKNTHGFDLGHCDGGNGDMSTAYFTRWDGPVWESEDPYDHTSDVSPVGLTEKRHIQDVYYIPARTSGTDNDALKEAIMTFGGVGVNLFFGDFYNPATYAYYYNGPEDPNHGGTLVGWDDNFDRNNFTNTPPGDGAWIIKNTWSEIWGESGYYYFSYYDSGLLDQRGYVYLTSDQVDNYGHNYQYDYLGWTSSVGYGTNTAHMANIFTAVADQDLAAVSFYAPSYGSTYTIKIYTNVGATPTSGTLANTPQTATLDYAGYRTIELDQTIPLSGGQKFSVVIQLTTPDTTFPLAMETPIPGYASSAAANAGESFISFNGSSWTDLTTIYPNTNIAVKAFTLKRVLYVAGNVNADNQADLVRYDKAIGLDLWDAATATWTNLLPFTLQIMNLTTADINNDNLDDVVIEIQNAGMHWRDSHTGVWTQILESQYSTKGFDRGDINGDGIDDLVADINGQGLYWRDSATGLWTSVLPSAYSIRTLRIADINGDAKDDIIVDIPGVGIHWRDSNTQGWTMVLEDWYTPLKIVAADTNGDNQDDLLVAVEKYGLYLRDSATTAWTFVESKDFTLQNLQAGDVDNDGNQDLIVDIAGFGLYEKNLYTTASNQILFSNYAPMTVISADISGDNKDDVFVNIYKVGQYWRDAQSGVWTQVAP